MSTEELFGISCGLHCDGPIQISESSVALHVYYIVKEAVNNAVKHSRAKVIEISFHSDKDIVSFTVRDDGTGFCESARSGKGLGLNLMRHRADIINASFEILHPEKGGTVVSCSFRNRKQTSRDS
jgi:signal transduction histidine kinase